MAAVTLGTDPEVFARATDQSRLDRLGIPSRLMGQTMPGYFAMQVADSNKPDVPVTFGALRPDGLALEFTVDPTDSVEVMVERLRANLHDTARIASEQSGSILHVEPRAYVDPWYIQQLPQEYGPACSLQLLGCAPDFSVYGINGPQKPDPRVHLYRTSGGHIHLEIGDMAKDRTAVCYLVAALDSTIGAASTILCDSEQALLRKEQYGQPGMVRVDAEHGRIEYRTLPAQALVQTPELARMMFTVAQNVATWMRDTFTTTNSRQAVETFRQIVGDFNYLLSSVVTPISEHDRDGCLLALDNFTTIAPKELEIGAVVDSLLAYQMPSGFDLVGW